MVTLKKIENTLRMPLQQNSLKAVKTFDSMQKHLSDPQIQNDV